MLQRALPELDDALALRIRSGYEIDPLAGLRFDRSLALRDALAHAGGPAASDGLVLAALVLDACEDVPVEPVVVARRTVQRLDLGTPVEQEVAGLVTDADLLAAAARRLDALTEESVLALAVHLGTSAHARALYLLTMATFDGEEWERERIDALHDLIQGALAHPELTGRAAANEVERRRAEAQAGTDDPEVRERILHAPREYVLGQTPADVLRHARLCEPTPGRNDVRVAVERVDGGVRVDVAARDRLGLIAAITRALHDAGCNVTAAVVVTWGDGTGFSSYAVDEPGPDATDLEQRIREQLRGKLDRASVARCHPALRRPRLAVAHALRRGGARRAWSPPLVDRCLRQCGRERARARRSRRGTPARSTRSSSRPRTGRSSTRTSRSGCVRPWHKVCGHAGDACRRHRRAERVCS